MCNNIPCRYVLSQVVCCCSSFYLSDGMSNIADQCHPIHTHQDLTITVCGVSCYVRVAPTRFQCAIALFGAWKTVFSRHGVSEVERGHLYNARGETPTLLLTLEIFVFPTPRITFLCVFRHLVPLCSIYGSHVIFRKELLVEFELGEVSKKSR